MRDSAHDRVRPPRFLVDAPTAAALLAISERAFHSLRKRSDFPQDATIILGPRCVRFRLRRARVRDVARVPDTPERAKSTAKKSGIAAKPNAVRTSRAGARSPSA